jgi:hypothetical protein
MPRITVSAAKPPTTPPMMALVFEPAGDTAVVVAATPATAALGVEFVVGEDFIDEPELEDEDEDEVREVEDDV